jgi:hypothetical protein
MFVGIVDVIFFSGQMALYVGCIFFSTCLILPLCHEAGGAFADFVGYCVIIICEVAA